VVSRTPIIKRKAGDTDRVRALLMLGQLAGYSRAETARMILNADRAKRSTKNITVKQHDSTE
jgi:hypothetical protein